MAVAAVAVSSGGGRRRRVRDGRRQTPAFERVTRHHITAHAACPHRAALLLLNSRENC